MLLRVDGEESSLGRNAPLRKRSMIYSKVVFAAVDHHLLKGSMVLAATTRGNEPLSVLLSISSVLAKSSSPRLIWGSEA